MELDKARPGEADGARARRQIVGPRVSRDVCDGHSSVTSNGARITERRMTPLPRISAHSEWMKYAAVSGLGCTLGRNLTDFQLRKTQNPHGIRDGLFALRETNGCLTKNHPGPSSNGKRILYSVKRTRFLVWSSGLRGAKVEKKGELRLEMSRVGA